MTNFVERLETVMNDDNIAYTENGALAFKTTKSDLLDFFAVGGALRERSETEVIELFTKAFTESPELALKCLFYFRDVRGGQGERRTFRIILKNLATSHPEIVRKLMKYIPTYGRWDDLMVLFDTDVEEDMITLIDLQLDSDLTSDQPSLLAKWLPSENASSKATKALAKRVRKSLNMTSQQYRKTLSAIRAKIKLVEQTMSKGEWTNIEYDKIPSRASLIYRNAFMRHDPEGYAKFIEAVNSGEKTINAATLYPYDIVNKVFGGQTCWNFQSNKISKSDRKALDAMWNSLPDYIGEANVRGIVVADTSGSMNGLPINVALSLAIYMAERNKGEFHNKFITFSNRPRLQTIEGNDIVEKVESLAKADWDMNTDIKAVFDLILSTAVNHNLDQSDLPTHLYIVSDMEFDYCTGSDHINERLFQTIDRKFRDAGYAMPFLVFWNVNSRNNQQPMSLDQRGFQLVSGCSPSIFTKLLGNQVLNAYDLMLEVLNDERYEPISI